MFKENIKTAGLISELKRLALNNYKALGSSYLMMCINALVFFFLTPFLLKILGEEQYGVWVLLTTIITYFSISNFGFNTSFMVAVPSVMDNLEKRNELINTVFFTLIFMSGVFSLVFVILDLNLQELFEVSPDFLFSSKIAFVFIFLSFVANILYGFFDSILYINNYIFEKNVIEILKQVVLNILIFVTVYIGFGIIGMGIAQLITFVSFFLILYAYTKKKFTFNLDYRLYSSKLFTKLLNPSIHYFLITIASQIIFYSDTILISSLSGVKTVAIYSIMYRTTDVFLRAIFKLSDVKVPMIAEILKTGQYLKLINYHNKLQVITLISIAPIFFILFFYGDTILSLWLGINYLFDKEILRVLSVSMVLNAIIHVSALFIITMGIHKKVSYMSTADAILNLILSVLFFNLFGLIGIPLGTLVSCLLTTFWYVLYTFYREIRITAIAA
jgi:O-antigen/teichoic acid export membrane protein